MPSESSQARIVAPPAVLAGMCVALGAVADRYFPFPLVDHGLIVRLGGSMLLFAAFGLLLLSALRTFREQNTTVDPYGKPRSLVTSGLFRHSRNPMYVGLLLLPLGFAVALNSVWLLASTGLLFLLLHFGVIRPEERFLAAHFGDTYQAYTNQVRRWL
jgi:protein-S-isoprenylcysteine O-methyltransferase Ste14